MVPADADEVREVAIRRGAADFDRSLVVERRSTHAEADFAEARIRAIADDLVDVAGQALGLGIGRSCTGGALQFLLAECWSRRRRIVVVRTKDGNAVELVADFVEVAAADVD